MQDGRCAVVLPVLQAPANTADVVPCERLPNFHVARIARCLDSDNAMQRFSSCSKFIHTHRDSRVLDERRGMMRLQACVNYKCPGTTPVFELAETFCAVYIMGWIRPGKCDPQEIG